MKLFLLMTIYYMYIRIYYNNNSKSHQNICFYLSVLIYLRVVRIYGRNLPS